MRFGAPRSPSPSPVRRRSRNSTAFGLLSDSDSEDYDSELDSVSYSDDDSISIAESSSSDDIELVSDINKLSIRPRHIDRTPREQRDIEETVAAIRLRTRYNDPYEEWEHETRKDAFRTARKEFNTTQRRIQDETRASRQKQEEEAAAENLRKAMVVEDFVDKYRRDYQQKEEELKASWRERERQLWERIENAIKLEEDKVVKKLEEERKAREEEERKQKEAELRKRLEVERKRMEEEKKKEEEEEQQRKAEEQAKADQAAEEKRQIFEEQRKNREAEEVGLRKMLTFSSVEEDWRVARENLKQLKEGPVRFVKTTKELKAEWGKIRRQIVPKIGQLTNDMQAISRISTQIFELLRPSNAPPLNEALYVTLCYSLSKAILLQAETEVTAEKRSAIPLAQVTFNLLSTLEHFPTIFFAKLVQRCGGWPLPYFVPNRDHTGQPWTDQAERIKAMGYRKSVSNEGLESPEEYSNRVSGVLRVYFHIIKITPVQPLYAMFKVSRCWNWFARLANDPKLLEHSIAPQLIYTALDVMGVEARAIWGQPWIKILALVYQGITTGFESGKLIGGDSPEGGAARTRALLAIEKVMSTPS